MSYDPRQLTSPAFFTRLDNLELRARGIVEGFMHGLHRSPFVGFSVEFASHREYAQGDDLKARRIRVNVLSPGPIQTLGFDVLADKDTRSALQSMVPFGRIGTAEEVANAALFLASDDSSYVAGIELFVDGGTVAV